MHFCSKSVENCKEVVKRKQMQIDQNKTGSFLKKQRVSI